MMRYDEPGFSDAAVGEAAADLIQSIRADPLAVLRTAPPHGNGRHDAQRLADSCEGGFRAANLAGVAELMACVKRLMFPGYFDPDPLWDGEIDAHVTRLTRRVAQLLSTEVHSVRRYRGRTGKAGAGEGGGAGRPDDADFVRHVVASMLRRLPQVRAMLALDVQAAYDGDPAAEHTDEVILCYPGLDAIASHRFAHELYRLEVPLLPRVISEQAHSRTGIDIHPGASVGQSVFIDHGSATVIGETSVIGRQVKIYQGVTLGAKSFPKDERGRAIKGLKRHPTIGDRVTIYAGAVILGGDTVIGDDCVIAGGVFVTSSVPAGHVVQQPRAELVLRPAPSSKASSQPATGPTFRVDVGWLGDGGGI
jgi:serine O-acetyltransferase